MLTVDYVHTLFAYNAWAREKFWGCLLTISDADFIQHESYSIGSLHAQTVHTMWAEALWLARIQGKPRVTFTAEDYPNRTLIWEKWQLVHQEWQAYLAVLDEPELNRQFEVVRMDGTIHRQIIWQTLIHLINHGTDHRSQMLRLIHDFGGKTFEQDMIFYFREITS